MAPLLLLFFFFTSSLTSSFADLPWKSCGANNGNFTSDSPYSSNLNLTLSTLSSTNTSISGFATSIIGIIPNRIYGHVLCRGDINATTCLSCITTAASDIQQICPYYKDADIYYDYCQLRFSNLDFLTNPDISSNIKLWFKNTQSISDDELPRYEDQITALMANITDFTVGNASQYFATGQVALDGVDVVYGLVQCARDLSATKCRSCLQEELDQITKNGNDLKGYRGVTVVGIWCNMRYEFYKFYDGTSLVQLQQLPSSQPPASEPSSPNNIPRSPAGSSRGGKGTVTIVLAISIPVVAGAVLIATLRIWFFRRGPKPKPPPFLLSGVTKPMEITDVESLLFDLSTLKYATSNFSEHMKLGAGGFGPVYKGVLPDGREIAVKRLSTESTQGLAELENELVLIAKLQHKNLVRLLGACLEGQEKLLIYEYVVNKSLDTILFDSTRSKLLDWDKRCKIIGGIARGLIYLHEDSQLRIIHRDLKASNVLLDANMNPKISDFGTARLFSDNETNVITTRVIGTPGYMAPEYYLYGQFSVKSDVYSFGVLLLEIVTGRSSSRSFNVSRYVWEHWNKGTIIEIVDPAAGNVVPTSEVTRFIQLGLLCVQTDPLQRPSMSEVLVELNSHTHIGTLDMPESGFSTSTFSSSSEGLLIHEYNRSMSSFTAVSPNELTISEVDPR